MERNVRLYPLYQLGRGLIFWLPVFFLFFSGQVGLTGALLLEAVYYGAVVVLEVPSGYFSDRLGRRWTLLIGAAAYGAGCLTFVLGAGFAAFAVAQALLAVGVAFNSGTDSALLYDSLCALDRGDEVGGIEARAYSNQFLALAFASLVGGILSGFDLRVAYALTAVGALLTFAVTIAFEEPPRAEAAPPPWAALREAGARLADPVLRWLFLFVVAMTVFNHVPYEFFQPYIDFLLVGHGAGDFAVTPAATGFTMAVMMGISAVASRSAIALRDRIGAPWTLALTLALQTGIIASMALALHPAVLVLVVLRSVPGALMRPVVNAAVHPRLPSGIRATYLSLVSLAGRLSFAGALALTAGLAASETLTPAEMSRILSAFASAAGACLVLVLLAAPRLKRHLEREPSN